MSRKMLTQLFPCLLPLRKAQRRFCYYLKMDWDKNRYAVRTADHFYPCELFADRSPLINEKTGADIQYQYNKVHNLKLAAATMNGLIIRPGETFSFWYLARRADRAEPYKDGLCVHNGRLVAVPGGGLCQLSNLLFWLFLHAPVAIVERHTHKVKEFPGASEDELEGVDATVLEGWLDLKVRNDSADEMQIELRIDGECLCGSLRTRTPGAYRYEVFNQNRLVEARAGKTFERVDVKRRALDAQNGRVLREETLYTNECELAYEP